MLHGGPTPEKSYSPILWRYKQSSVKKCDAHGRKLMTHGMKDQQGAELPKTIWQVTNDLRGSVDGWDFKSYVLGMLFYRFISENLTSYINKGEREAGSPNSDFATLPDGDAEFVREEAARNPATWRVL